MGAMEGNEGVLEESKEILQEYTSPGRKRIGVLQENVDLKVTRTSGKNVCILKEEQKSRRKDTKEKEHLCPKERT